VLLVLHLALRVAFATFELGGDRFWDERFGLANVGALVGQGQLEPATAYHPGLSYLPQAAVLGVVEALYRATGDEQLRLFVPVKRADGETRRVDYTPLTFLICRLVQAVYGTVSLLLVFFLGRRLFSAPVGLLAAAFLGAMPWHVRQSVIFKPDILLLLCIVLALLLFLRAFERPTPRRFAAAGVGIGLALASKFNAAPIVLPFLVGAAIEVWRGRVVPRAMLRGVAIAAAVSLGVLLALVPFLVIEPEIYVRDFSIVLDDYEEKADDRAGGSSLVALARGAKALVSYNFFGAVVGACALAGWVLLGLLPWPRGVDWRRRLGRIVAASYVVGYTIAYGVVTANPSPHNWLPVTPVLAVFAAGLLGEAWHRLVRRSGTVDSAGIPIGSKWHGAAAPLLALALVVVAVRPARYVYETLVPATVDRAAASVLEELRPRDGESLPRIVALESRIDVLRFDAGPRYAALPAVERFTAGSTDAPLDPRLADAVVYEAETDYRSGYADSRELAAPPAWFRWRGPSLVVAVHRWEQVGSPETLAWTVGPEGRVVAELAAPALAAAPSTVAPVGATHVSFELLVRAGDEPPEVGDLAVDGVRLPFLRAGRAARRFRFLSPRLPSSSLASAGTLRLDFVPADHPGADRIELVLYRWAPPGSGAVASGPDASGSAASASFSASSESAEVATDSR
jgi:hypothetical protein